MALTARSRPATGWMRPARAYQPTAVATLPSRSWARAARSPGSALAQVVAQRPHLLGVAAHRAVRAPPGPTASS